MRDWRDLNGDGIIDGAEMMFADEMLCTGKDEHMALFGNAGDFEDETDEDEEREYDLALHGLDPDELADMDEDDRIEALEDAGLDPNDYDFD